jgi:hypothetical protein
MTIFWKYAVIGNFVPTVAEAVLSGRPRDDSTYVDTENPLAAGAVRNDNNSPVDGTHVSSSVVVRDDWYYFRYWLMSNLISSGNLNGVSGLIGTHYEGISIIYRLLGAKIGKRVYWPGSGE